MVFRVCFGRLLDMFGGVLMVFLCSFGGVLAACW